MTEVIDTPAMRAELTKEERLVAHAVQMRLKRLSGDTYRHMDLAREAMILMDRGWSQKKVAIAVNRSTRNIQYAIAKYGRFVEAPIARSDDWTPKPANAALLRWDVDAFCEFVTRFGPHRYVPEHVKPWIAAFLRERNLLLNVPPRHAKSFYFMVWLPIWLICRNRNVQILLVSNAVDDARTWALEIAGQLEHNDDLIGAYGAFKPFAGDKWSPTAGTFNVRGRTKTARGAQFTVESRGMTQRVLGREADFVIVDDPTNQEEAASESERIKQLSHLREQVFSRAEPEAENQPGGRVCVVGQRVHLLDLFGELERQTYEIGPDKGQHLFHTEKYPAILDWSERKVLWPERFSWDELMLTYARVGGHGPFSCMYQQQPLPEGDGLLRSEWVEACKDPGRPAGAGVRRTGDQAYLPVVRVISVDPSPTKWNAIIVGDVLVDREQFHFYVTEIYRMKAGLRELTAKVDEIIMRTEPDYFIFEESGFLAWLREDPWFQGLRNRIKVILHRTGANKNRLDYGVQSLAGDFEFGRISLPYGDATARAMTDMFADEALLYPSGDSDDMLMALWFPKPNRDKLVRIGFLPTQIKTNKYGKGGWSFMASFKDKQLTDDAWYERWQKEKHKLREQVRKASVG